MTDTPSLSEQLREIASWMRDPVNREPVLKAADALDAKDAQIRAANDALFNIIYDGKDAIDAKDVMLSQAASTNVIHVNELLADIAKKDAEIERLRGLIQCLIENEPDAPAADGVTVLDVWRKEALAAIRATLVEKVDD